jgi:DNA-binding beta-propeller fold protein YncE
LFARFASSAALLALQLCTPAVAAPRTAAPPEQGVMLLSLRTGATVAQVSVGEDPLALALAPDGGTAYVADNDLGDVFALGLPALRTAWRTHVGGRPSALLVHGANLFVSQYDSAQVAKLDSASGRLLEEMPVAPHPGELAWTDHLLTSGGRGFGLAVVGGEVWTPARLPPLEGRPFWLAAGRGGELLVTTEGVPEDSAFGSVVSLDTASGRASVLARPRDPDEAERLGDSVFVAAHGDREVLVLRNGRMTVWAKGAEAVALAPDAPLGLLVVLADADE